MATRKIPYTGVVQFPYGDFEQIDVRARDLSEARALVERELDGYEPEGAIVGIAPTRRVACTFHLA